MKSSFGCGIIFGVIAALAVCGIVWFFFYCRSNPQNAEEHFKDVEQGWENVKDGGDKGLLLVKEKFTGKKNVEPPIHEVPATAPLLPPHPEDKK